MVRSAAAADSELVTSLISFTPPQMQVAARTHRLVPAASCAPIMASSARVAASTSAPISPILIFPNSVGRLDHHKPVSSPLNGHDSRPSYGVIKALRRR